MPSARAPGSPAGDIQTVSEPVDRGLAGSHDPWRWLLELRGHLVPDVEVVDARGEPVLPPVRGDVADRLRRQLRSPAASSLRSAIRDATPGAPVTFASGDGLRFAAVGLADQDARFTLVLAERADAGRDAARRAELARMASWLARAFASTSGNRVRDWRELSVLHQVLQKATTTGSLPAVVRAYAEALAIWADTDTRAYIGNHADRFVLEVALAGAVAADAPRSLPADAVAGSARMRRLEDRERRALGFAAGADTLVSIIRINEQAPWLMAYTGRFTPVDEERLTLFEDMLVPALQATSEVEASRLTWTMMQHLVDRARASRDAAAAALFELERAGLCTAALLVLRHGGAVVLQLGLPAPDGGRNDAWPSAAVQRFALSVPEPFEASLTLWRPADRPFTRRETRLGAIGASVLGDWVAGVLKQHDLDSRPAAIGPSDRRRSPGNAVSLLVVLPEAGDTAAEVREGWLQDIRRQLRTTDIAGALASGDISLLLPGAGGRDAQAVASRLARLFAQDPALALLDGAPIGIASVGGSAEPTTQPG